MTPATPARTSARRVVTRVREQASFAHEALHSALSGPALSREQLAFATRLAYGTVATRGTLDEVVGRFLNPDVRLEPRVSDCLAVSTYELLFMRTPARAAVNEGVELVKAVAPRASTLANAVLRRIATDAGSFPWGDPTNDEAALARLTGHPEWMVRALTDELGEETATRVLEANNEPAPLYLAHMPFQVSFDELLDALEREGARPRPMQPTGAVVCDVPSAAVRSSALSKGWAIVVDAAAQFAATCVPLTDGATIVDIGAGRGTKTLLLAARAHRQGVSVRITAVDSHGFKLDLLRQAVERVLAPPVLTLVADATDLESTPLRHLSADAVLIDAPCSGLGTLRRHPDRRWRARPEDVETLAAIGGAILRASSTVVKPGGFVVYSTCTIVKAENEHVVEGFLASPSGADFRLDPLGADEAPASWAPFFAPSGVFRSIPLDGGPDGHFVARLKRVASK